MDMASDWTLKSEVSEESLSLSVHVCHPEMGSFFDAVMYVKKSARSERNECGGFQTLLRCILS